MEHIEGIIKLADAEMGSIEKNGKFRSREEIDSVYKLMDIVKDAYCIMDMEEDGYSEYDGSSYRSGYSRNNYGGMYDGNSYARGRGRNARRDSMGRYSRDGGAYRGGSYRYDGYSRDGKEEYIENLRNMMDEAPDDQTRQSIQRMIQQMEQG